MVNKRLVNLIFRDVYLQMLLIHNYWEGLDPPLLATIFRQAYRYTRLITIEMLVI